MHLCYLSVSASAHSCFLAKHSFADSVGSVAVPADSLAEVQSIGFVEFAPDFELDFVVAEIQVGAVSFSVLVRTALKFQ